MENLELIYDDEDVIGKVSEIRKCFINELSKNLQDNELEIEDKINQINLIQDLLKQIKNEDSKRIIRVSFNPMGTFYYTYLG